MFVLTYRNWHLPVGKPHFGTGMRVVEGQLGQLSAMCPLHVWPFIVSEFLHPHLTIIAISQVSWFSFYPTYRIIPLAIANEVEIQMSSCLGVII